MSKKSTLLNLAVISTLSFATACSKSVVNSSKQTATSTSSAIMMVEQGQTYQAAQIYSRIGEILLSKPEGALHAEEMFSKSLELNSYNEKANLYSALLAPSLTIKGFARRFQNIGSEERKTSFPEMEAYIRKTEVKEFIDFALVMPEGKVEAKNVEDVRKFIRNEYVKELEKSIAKLDKLKEAKLTLALDISQYSAKESRQTTCIEDASGAFTCDEEKAVQNEIKYHIDKHDIKALSIILKTEKNALVMASSIGLKGFEEVAAKVEKLSVKTDRAVIEAIKTQPNLLKLEGSRDDLLAMFDHTEETLNDLMDFSRISKEVCNSDERKNNLANEICVSEQAAEKINEMLMFIVGPREVILGVDENGNDVSVEVNLRALLDSKVTSLQELLPTKFDENGKVKAAKDLTFMGVIPNADLIAKLKTVVK